MKEEGRKKTQTWGRRSFGTRKIKEEGNLRTVELIHRAELAQMNALDRGPVKVRHVIL